MVVISSPSYEQTQTGRSAYEFGRLAHLET